MKHKILTLILMMCSSLFLVNCQKSSSNNSTPATVSTAGACSAGYVYTQYGCLPQSSCPVNYGMYNGSCYPATATTNTCSAGSVYTTMGCLPQGTCPVNYGYSNGSCYPATTTTTGTGLTCLSTDIVNTQIGQLTVGVCQPYCAQYGRKYGYSNGYCYPAY